LETIIVLWFQQVDKFVDQNEFHALYRLFGQLKVEPNPLCSNVTTTPLRFHASDSQYYIPNTNSLLPLL
jgi:hypothetical protein